MVRELLQPKRSTLPTPFTRPGHRLRTLGDFSYMNAYMSQPKLQLETFRAWAGISSDISFYLNS